MVGTDFVGLVHYTTSWLSSTVDKPDITLFLSAVGDKNGICW
jgi:hypothetical protein